MDCLCFLLFWQRWCPLRFGRRYAGFLRQEWDLYVYVRSGVLECQRVFGVNMCVGVESWGRREH